MEIRLIPVTEENRAAAEALQVLPHQIHFIETVAECLREADGLALWHPMGILEKDRLVGFTMYGYFPGEQGGRLWFDRLLIEGASQGRGLGKQAIRVILSRMEAEFPGEDIYLSVYDDNPRAISLYRYYGFAFNGELDTKGEKVMVRRAGTAFPPE